MHPCVRLVHELVTDLAPGDDLEAAHRSDTLRWLESTDDVFRRVQPDVPARHLVSYVLLVDPDDGAVLLADHIRAGLWLPPGGHVEPGEHPAAAAGREAGEELGIAAEFASPSFLTVTRTRGHRGVHEDVSLWFLLRGSRRTRLRPDPREFRSVRWWTPGELRAEDAGRFDPHLGRFLAKAAVHGGGTGGADEPA